MLLFGRNVRGPFHLMKSLWTKELTDLTNVKPNVIDYILDLRSRLDECIDSFSTHQAGTLKSKRWYNKKAVSRSFVPDE